MVPPTIKHRIAIFAFVAAAATSLLACDVGSSPASEPSPPATATTPLASASPPAAALPQSPANNEFTLTITRRIRYVWPAAGAITTYFGAGHPTGIDIALDLSSDSPIRAAGNGTVSFAGGDPCCSLGIRVDIEHEGGGRTVYGHLASVSVQQGQAVKQGDVIGLGGTTGESDGKHLHFEIYQDDALVDPLRYLPSDQQSASGTERISCAETTVRLDPDSGLDLRILPRTLSGYEIQTVAYTGISVAARSIGIEAAKQSILTAAVRVPPLAVAAGETMEAGLDIVMASPGAENQQLSCRLVLRTRATLPNPPGTGQRHVGGVGGVEAGPPTATPTRTPISGPQVQPTLPAAPRNPTPQKPPVANPSPQRPPVQRP